jgi:hypothetical protein
MNVAEACAECLRLSDAYETVTMAWFRLEGNLRIAEYGRDEESSRNLAQELTEIADRRLVLRSAMNQHQQSSHPRAAAAAS